MQIRHSILYLFFFLLFFSLAILVKAQEKVTVSVSDQPLSTVLNKISDEGKARFAFDNDFFSGIIVTISVEEMEIEKFLNYLSGEYPIGFKQIGGTWVLFKTEKPVIITTKPIVPVKEVTEEIITEKEIPVFIQPRIYYFSGRVFDAQTGDAVKYCNVLVPEGKTALTDEQGVFFSEIVSTGKTVIKIGHLGYLPLDTLVYLPGNTFINLALQPVTLMNFHKANSKKVKFQLDFHDKPGFVAFNGNASMVIPSLFSGDQLNLYSTFPGVSGFGLSSDGAQVRDVNYSENISYIDGIPLYEPYFLFNNQSLLNASTLVQSYLSRGGYGLEYDGGISGTALHTLKTVQNCRPVLELDANLLDAALFTMLPVGKKVSISAFFRKSLVEYWPNYLFKNISENIELKPYLQDVSGEVENPEASYFDFNVKLLVKPSQNSEIAVAIIGNQLDESRIFSWVLPDEISEEQYNTGAQYGGSLKWSAQINQNWVSSFSAKYIDFRRRKGSIYTFEELALNEELDENTLSQIEVQWRSEIQQKNFIHYFGAGYKHYDFSYNYTNTALSDYYIQWEVVPYSLSTINNVVDIYYQTRFNVASWMRIKAGAKALYDYSVQDFQVLPNGSIEINPNKSVKLYYLTGRYLQELYRSTRFDTDLSRSPIWFLPDKGTFFTSSFQNIIGGNFSKGGFLVNFEAYSKLIEDKPLLFAHSDFSSGNEIVSYKIYKSTATSQGIDLFAQYSHSVFTHTLAYSIASNFENVNSINSGNSFWSLTDRLHILKLSEVVSFKGWMASLNWNFATGIPYLDASSTVDMFSMGRSSNFSRLDFSLMKQFKVRSARFEIGLSLMNLLNNINTNDIEFSYLRATSGNEWIVGKTFYDIPFSPQAHISVRFE